MSDNLEPTLSQAERMLPIKIPRSLRGRDDEKENVSSKYSKVVINLPGVEGTTITTRRNTFHPAEAFLTPLKPLERPAVTSPRGKRPTEFYQVNNLSLTKSPLLRLQKLREQAQERLRNGSFGLTDTSPLRNVAHVSSNSRDSDSLASEDVALNRSVTFAAHDDVLESSPSKKVDILSETTIGARVSQGASYSSPQADKSSNGNTEPIAEANFSRTYVQELQEVHRDRLQELEDKIASKTKEIKHLNTQIYGMRQNLADLQDKNLQQNNNLELSRDQKSMLEEELRSRNEMIVVLNRDLAQQKSMNTESQLRIKQMKMEMEENVKDADHLRQEMGLLEETRDVLERLTDEQKKSLEESRALIDALQEEKLDLLKTLEDSEASARSLQRDLDIMKTDLAELRDENVQLKQTIEEKELAQRSSNEKLQELMKETETIHEEMATFEKEYKQLELQLLDKTAAIESLEAENRELSLALEESRKSHDQLQREVSQLQSDQYALTQDKAALEEQIGALKSQHLEKDEIISGDTNKMGQLVLEIEQLKKDLASKARQQDDSTSNYDAQQHITSLQQQIASAQEKTDERIQEVAEQLYHQYSKKHEVKVGQLKKKFEIRLEENRAELEAQKRKIETLERLLLAETKDKNHLLMLLEDRDLLRLR